MYETDAGSGIYELSDSSSWNTDGYVFNEALSKCENGGTLIWANTPIIRYKFSSGQVLAEEPKHT